MSERNEVPTTQPSPATPQTEAPPGATEELASRLASLPAAMSLSEEDARARIAALEREAKAVGTDPSAAILFHEIGLLWEDPLKNPRNAAVAYQNAYKLAPRFVSNIRAARRLFADVGNWQMVVQLIDAELAATDDARARNVLLFEKAQVLEQRLSREADALRTYHQVLEARPSDVSLLVQLEQVYAEKGEHAALVEIYRLLAGALEDDLLRAQYLTLAGQLLEDRLKQLDASAECYRQALALDRKNPLLLAAVKRMAERENSASDLLAALAAEAELQGANAAPTYLRISKVYERLGRREDALAALHAARKVNPGEPLILAELAQIYEAEGRHEALADVLLSWVGSIGDENELVAINLRLAALYEESLKRDLDAIARYQAILARIPGHSAALAGLGKLYHRTQDWAGLLATYDAEIAATPDPRQKAARMYKAAEVLEERLGRQEDAIARYNQCLQLMPGFLPAQKALTRLFERQGRFDELVAMHEQDLLQTTDREQVITTLNKMAAICEDRVGDLDRAIDCLRRILELSSDHLPTIRNLARLYERARRWQDLIQIQETEAGLVADTKQVLSLHHRNAELLEEHLKDQAGAIAAYERVLALSPSYLPALKALGRLYAQDGRWHDLARMYRAEAEISASADQAAALIYKIGELSEQKTGDTGEAIAAYREVLTLSPNYFPAVRALARIYRGQGEWEALIEVLRAEAVNRTDPVERANALFQAAAIWEDQLNRPEMAVEGYQEVLRLTPGHTPALRALERLYSSQGNLKELITILDHETQVGQPTAKVSAYLKLARLYLDRLNEPSRAGQCCEAALAIEPGSVGALKMLERVRASDLTRRGEVKARLADAVGDGKLRTALRLVAANERDRTALAPAADGVQGDDLLAELKAAFLEDPADATLGSSLERALRLAGDFAGLIELYARKAQVTSDPAERLEYTLRVATLYESKLQDPKRAAEAYQQALELDGNLIPALQGARRVWLTLGETARARDMLESEARVSRDVQTALEAYVAAGKLSAKLKESERAATNFRKALERDPLNPEAGTGLEEILAASGGAADLAGLHERRGEAKLAQKDTVAAANEFFTAALTWLERLNDRARTFAALERALAAQPTHPEALEVKGDLSLDAGNYAEAAAAFAARVQQGGEPKLLTSLHLKLGALHHDQLGDVTRAAAHLQTALAADPGCLEALERLAAIHTSARNWTGAADALNRLIELVPEPAALARHHVALAGVVEEGLGDGPQAAGLYRRALELAPGDLSVVERLVALYERLGNLPELAQMLEQQAQRSSDPHRKLSLLLKVGEIYARPLDDPQKAIAAYRGALELDASSVPAHAALAELYMRDAAAAPMAIEEHRTLLRLEPGRVDSLHALFRLWEGLRQKDKAFCVVGVLHALKAANEAEAAFYSEEKSRLPQDSQVRLEHSDVTAIMHPRARNVLVDVLRVIGDQLTKLYPPQFEQLGIDRKADRLKSDHSVYKAIRAVAQVFGVEELDVFQARRGLMSLETTEPLSVCVGQEVVRKFNAREQKFLIGQAVMGLFNKAAIVRKLSAGEVTELLGNSVRIFHPELNQLGRRNDDASKQLRKAYSRRALKALEEPAGAAAGTPRLDVPGTLEGLALSADRAGFLMCGDVAAGLSMLLKGAAEGASARGDEPSLEQALRQRADVREAFAFVTSDEFFRLRQKVGIAL